MINVDPRVSAIELCKYFKIISYNACQRLSNLEKGKYQQIGPEIWNTLLITVLNYVLR